MKIEIKFEDNSDKFLNDFEDKKPELTKAVGNELYKSIYNYMTEDDIVDTGRLRGSISYSTPYEDYKNPTIHNTEDDFVQGIRKTNTIYYGSNVEYASFVDLGTSKQRARNFMLNGSSRAIPQIKRVVEIILKGE